jgi:hypothetical protein
MVNPAAAAVPTRCSVLGVVGLLGMLGAPGTAGCDSPRGTRMHVDCVDVVDASYTCTVGDDGAPSAAMCLLGSPDYVVSCAAVCGRNIAACAQRDGDVLAADQVCGCPPCTGDADCGDVEFCAWVGGEEGAERYACWLTAPGLWSVRAGSVTVPDLDDDNRAWDPDSGPDIQLELTLDGEPWWTSPVAPDTTAAEFVTLSAPRAIRGDEELGLIVYEVDGSAREIVEGVAFFRIGSVLNDGGYYGTLLDVDHPTTVRFALDRIGDLP